MNITVSFIEAIFLLPTHAPKYPHRNPQAVLHRLNQRGVDIIPKSVKVERMLENHEILILRLMNKI